MISVYDKFYDKPEQLYSFSVVDAVIKVKIILYPYQGGELLLGELTKVSVIGETWKTSA